MKNNARIPNISAMIQTGIDPKTGLPVKAINTEKSCLKRNIKQLIKTIDRQDAFRKYAWYNLPDGLSGDMLERILYYRGQAILFYMPTNNTFYFLPYALQGNIDVYGRYLEVTPLPFSGPASTTDNKKQKAWIEGLTRKPVYEVVMPWELTAEVYENSAVILKDYSNGIEQLITPRNDLNDGLVDMEAEMLPFMRTALIGLTGIAGMRVNSEDEQSNVKAASQSLEAAALTGDKWVPIVGQIDFQSLDTSNIANVQQFAMAMNTVDNLRLSTHGLDNGGLFQKTQSLLQDEFNMSNINAGIILQDGLTLRQNFCTIANSIWGLNIWCEISQPASMRTSQDLGNDISNNHIDDTVHEADKGATDNKEDIYE